MSGADWGEGSVLKNNIIYGNTSGDFSSDKSADNTISDNWLNATGDPKFVSTNISDQTSETVPDLSLQSSSGAIDNGTYLTTVHADDTSSGTSLILTDALYFQDGTWGSSLSSIAADYICVGATVAAAECMQISAINYATNTLTVADFTREDGDLVWLQKDSDGDLVLYGSAPDQGAHEFDSTAATCTGICGGGGEGWSMQ